VLFLHEMERIISSDKLRAIPSISQVIESAKILGLETYIVGGYVRDLQLKRGSSDIDFVCIGSGISLAEEVSKSLPDSHLAVYKNFGTALVKWQDMELEFVGARKESYRSNSRKPIVEDGTLEDDQNRRDFTINAMAISLNKANFGELLDPFNGISDIRKKQIRTPIEPGITFSDDPLRMMRAIRFAAQLDFDIEPTTFDGIIENVDRIDIVSKERVADELNKIILAPKPSYGFKLLFHAGLLHKIFPEMIDLLGVETRNGMSHKDNFYHTLQVLDNVANGSDDLWLRWAAILHDIAKPATKRFNEKAGWTFHGHEDKGARMVPKIFRRMKLPLNEHMHFVVKLVRLHLRPIALVKDEITDSAIRRLLFEAGNDIDALMHLCKADITSKNHVKVKRYLGNFRNVEQKLKDVEERDSIKNFQPPITGQIIMNTFAIEPSRQVGEIKDKIREAIIDGHILNNYEEAYAMMLAIGKEMGLKEIKKN
jgi:poly(A) polymerase